MNFNVHQQKLNWSNGKNCLLFFLMNTHFICFPQMLTLGLHSKHVQSIWMLLCITCNTFSHDDVEVLFIFNYRMCVTTRILYYSFRFFSHKLFHTFSRSILAYHILGQWPKVQNKSKFYIYSDITAVREIERKHYCWKFNWFLYLIFREL